jgi:hypothetical protein
MSAVEHIPSLPNRQIWRDHIQTLLSIYTHFLPLEERELVASDPFPGYTSIEVANIDALQAHVSPIIFSAMELSTMWIREKAASSTPRLTTETVHLYFPAWLGNRDCAITFTLGSLGAEQFLDYLRKGYTLEHVLGKDIFTAFERSVGSKSGKIDSSTGDGMLKRYAQSGDVLLTLPLENESGMTLLARLC